MSKIFLKFFYFFFSTGSYHHFPHGIHLKILPIHFIVQRITHFFSIASIIYSLFKYSGV